jgi:hypothetical protein
MIAVETVDKMACIFALSPDTQLFTEYWYAKYRLREGGRASVDISARCQIAAEWGADRINTLDIRLSWGSIKPETWTNQRARSQTCFRASQFAFWKPQQRMWCSLLQTEESHKTHAGGAVIIRVISILRRGLGQRQSPCKPCQRWQALINHSSPRPLPCTSKGMASKDMLSALT